MPREDLRLHDECRADWAYGGRAASRRAPDAEILCFGDSMIKFGMAPRVLEDRLGRRAFNLALYAGSPTASYFLLRRPLESGAKPAAVLVDFQPRHSPWHRDSTSGCGRSCSARATASTWRGPPATPTCSRP